MSGWPGAAPSLLLSARNARLTFGVPMWLVPCRFAEGCWCQIGLYIKDENSGAVGMQAPLPRSRMSRVPARPELRVSCPSQLHELFLSARHPDRKTGNAKQHSILKKRATFGVCGGRMRCCLEGVSCSCQWSVYLFSTMIGVNRSRLENTVFGQRSQTLTRIEL